MKKFISGLLVGVLLMGTVAFAAPALTYVKSAFTTVVYGKTVKQNVVTIGGVYYTDVKQLASSLGIKYAVDAKTKKITLGETSKTAAITFSNISFREEGDYTYAIGEVKNASVKKCTIGFKLSFYDTDKKLIGTVSGTVSDLEPGDTKTFDTIGQGNFANSASYKIQVEYMF